MIERHCRPLLDLLNEDLKKLQRQSYGSHDLTNQKWVLNQHT